MGHSLESVLEGDNMVSGLHVGDALTNRLDDTSTLVSQDDGESTLGILAGQRICIYSTHSAILSCRVNLFAWGCTRPVWQTPV